MDKSISRSRYALSYSTQTWWRYASIDSETEFRLLTISAVGNGRIEANMTVHCRNAAPPYRALSYTWGDRTADQIIYCDDRRLPVTRNCEKGLRALRSLRRRDLESPAINKKEELRKEYFWIDALCIDQGNYKERSEQVAVMAEIFKNAQETIVYLGSCPEMRTEGGMRIDQKALFTKPWFTRTWIVQEVLCSRQLSVLFDDRVLPWSVLEDSEDNVSELWVDSWDVDAPEIIGMRQALLSQPGVLAMRYLSSRVRWPYVVIDETEIEARAKQPNGRQQTQQASAGHDLKYTCLLGMLERIRDFGCLDPRDKLYGIISLFEKPTPPELIPEYAKTVEEVYMDLSWYLIQHNVYLALYFKPGEHRRDTLPSWVIDWEHDSLLYSTFNDVMYFPPETSHKGRNAGFWRVEERIYARREGRHITIRGLFIDYLDVSDPFDSSHSRVMLVQPDHREMYRYCSGPQDVRNGDCLVVLFGFATPFVLRPADGDIWALRGECFVDGLMSGEAFRNVHRVTGPEKRYISPLRDFRIC